MARIKLKYPVRLKSGGDTYGQEACVYKIWADEKFMIWKGRSFSQSVSQTSGTIERGLRIPLKPDNPFKKLVAFIIERRCLYVEVEPVTFPKTSFDLLKMEQTLLWQEQQNINCINTLFDAYMPEWIPVGSRESFEEWKSLNNK